MARRFVRAQRAPGFKTWIGQGSPAFGSDLTAGSGLFSAGNKFTGGPSGEDVTILRTRGSMIFNTEASAAILVNGNYSIAVGIGLTTTEAAVAGAVPLPYENPDWDGWFFYQTLALEPYIAELAGTQVNAYRAVMQIDSKAMRKHQAGMVLFLSTQVFSGFVGVAGINVFSIISIRQLLKTS